MTNASVEKKERKNSKKTQIIPEVNNYKQEAQLSPRDRAMRRVN